MGLQEVTGRGKNDEIKNKIKIKNERKIKDQKEWKNDAK